MNIPILSAMVADMKCVSFNGSQVRGGDIMNEKIIGFIYKHDHNDYEIIGVELSKEDEETIEKILYKYEFSAWATRGDKNLSLADAEID